MSGLQRQGRMGSQNRTRGETDWGGGVEIADAAKRAISLDQLGLIAEHMVQRLQHEAWPVRRWDVASSQLQSVNEDDCEAIKAHQGLGWS